MRLETIDLESVFINDSSLSKETYIHLAEKAKNEAEDYIKSLYECPQECARAIKQHVENYA